MALMDAQPRLTVVLPDRALTLDDVAALAAADTGNHRYELDEGNLLVMPPPDAEHAALIIRIGAWFLSGGYPPDRVLATPGLKIKDQVSGRNPDLLVLSRPVPSDTVWVDPDVVVLAIEIVSPGSQKLDRVVKPAEYAKAGVPHYWRVERSPATVHKYTLATDEDGEPVYLGHQAVLLDELLAGPPPQF